MASNDDPLVPTPPVVAGLDRKAVERILARATQLNAANTSESPELITQEQLFEIGKEVGLSPASINQALAEERTHLDIDTTPDTGWVSHITGPTMVSAQRVVSGDMMQAMGKLDKWMQDGEYLQVQRQFPDRMVWEPRTDWAAIMLKAWRTGGRSYYLREARGVAASIVPIDAERVLVRLDADVLPTRNHRVALGASVAGVGVLVGAALGTLGALFHVPDLALLGLGAIPIAGAGVGGHAILRSHRNTVARVKLGLEQAIDKLDYGAPRKPGLLESIIPRPLPR